MRILRGLRDVWRLIDTEGRRRVYRTVWPAWAGVLLIWCSTLVKVLWGRMPFLIVACSGLALMLLSYYRLRPLLRQLWGPEG